MIFLLAPRRKMLPGPSPSFVSLDENFRNNPARALRFMSFCQRSTLPRLSRSIQTADWGGDERYSCARVPRIYRLNIGDSNENEYPLSDMAWPFSPMFDLEWNFLVSIDGEFAAPLRAYI